MTLVLLILLPFLVALTFLVAVAAPWWAALVFAAWGVALLTFLMVETWEP